MKLLPMLLLASCGGARSAHPLHGTIGQHVADDRVAPTVGGVLDAPRLAARVEGPEVSTNAAQLAVERHINHTLPSFEGRRNAFQRQRSARGGLDTTSTASDEGDQEQGPDLHGWQVTHVPSRPLGELPFTTQEAG